MAYNPATSVVDFLSSRGIKPTSGERFPLYNQRKQYYESLGLNKNLGDFSGTADQNTALLNSLARVERENRVSISPENILDVLKVGSNVPSPSVPPVPPAPLPGETPTTPTTPENPTLSKEQMDSVFGRNLSPEEISSKALEMVMNKTTFPLQQEAAEAEKAALRVKGQQESEDLISKLASRGLFFSGKKTTGTQAIEADTLAKQLGVDRKFALLIATGLQTAAQQIAKDAQQGNKDALTSLRSLGFDVNPVTGAIEPTLAARKALASEERLLAGQEATQQRFEEGQANIQKRFDESQANIMARFNETQARLQKDSGAVAPEDIPVISAFTSYVISGKDNSGKEFGLTNVPEKYRGPVAVAVLESQRQSLAPRDWTDEEFRIAIRSGKEEGLDMNGILQQIDTDPSIQNKERAKLIARELFGVATGGGGGGGVAN